MHRLFATTIALAIACSLTVPGVADEATTRTAALAPDYGQAAHWVCRPEAEQTCTSGLDYRVDGPQGLGPIVRFAPAANPAIDCFYVYPTVSQEQSMHSDFANSPEIRDVVNRQAGRLTSRCRVFAPIYRQLTLYGLDRLFTGEADNPSQAIGDVAAAWAYYLAHDNGGRGVVLVGHSQGTILLQQLIANKIDGTPQQKLLVSAFLAGDPSLGVPTGKDVGGTFAHVPVCSSIAQTGCAYAWGSYLTGDSSPQFAFGTPLDGSMISACAHPAAPSGGSGKLEFFHHKAAHAAASDPIWIETVDQLSGACHSDAAGDGFIVTVSPGPRAATYKTLLKEAEVLSGWGLHLFDVALAQGNILDVLDAEIGTWTARNRAVSDSRKSIRYAPDRH